MYKDDKITILYKHYDDKAYNRVSVYDYNTAYHFISVLQCDEFCEKYLIYYNGKIVKSIYGFLSFLEDNVKLKRCNI